MDKQPLLDLSEEAIGASAYKSIACMAILSWFCRQILFQRKQIYILITFLVPIFYLLCYYLSGLNAFRYKYSEEGYEIESELETQGINE